MLSWLTGTRPVEYTRTSEDEELLENTVFEAPETPAPVFAVRAFRHAIFGTPQPCANDYAARLAKTRKESQKVQNEPIGPAENKEKTMLSRPEENTRPASPLKAGILLTPGTVRGKRKEVTFGAHVVDNEGKKPSRTGIPNNYPGKFPSPFTPKAIDLPKEEKPKTKLTEALFEAKSTKTSPTGKTKGKLRETKPRAKDDADITIDMMEPRSESGRYWKEKYLLYSQKSEEETKKLIAKQKLAKEYARKKDQEATQLRRQLELEMKGRHGREKSLERQNKELKEHLRRQMGENFQSATEIALLRKQADKALAVKPAPPANNTPEPREVDDLIWEDAAAINEDYSRDLGPAYLQASLAQTHGEQARASRTRKDHRLTRKPASIGRQDSAITPKGGADSTSSARPTPEETITITSMPDYTLKEADSSTGIPQTTPTPQASRIKPTHPVRRTLGERNPNIVVSSPASHLPSPGDHESTPKKSPKVQQMAPLTATPKFDPSTFLDTFDASAPFLDSSAPMEALSMQADQPVTPEAAKPDKSNKRDIPTPIPSAKKHTRSEAPVIDIPSHRADQAKARLAERKAARRRQKENCRTS